MDPDQYPELPDDIEESTDFVLDNSDIVEEDSLMYMDFFYSFISIFYEVSLSVRILSRLLNLCCTFRQVVNWQDVKILKIPEINFHIFLIICELNQIWSAEEEIEELVIVNNNNDDSGHNYDEDVFVTADVIEEVEDEFYSWALEIEQVNLCLCQKNGLTK